MKIVSIFVALFILGSCSPEKAPRLCSREIDRKVEKLISQMTLREKLGQLSQTNYWGDTIADKYKNAIRKGEVGSFLNTENIHIINELQRIAIEESRLHIPLIFGRDVIHGYRTVFPIQIGMTCSWNPALVQEATRIAAREARADGYQWAFAPMLDVTRNPRWGRVAESCGEDPYLGAQMARALVHGFQGDTLGTPGLMAACAKHFVGYGASEDGKDYQTTWIPEPELRNTYLPPFKAAVDAGVATIMSAFNDLNGIPTSGNELTLNQILRKEWRFGGFVVSDWESVTQMITHGYCVNEKEAAIKAIRAGVDMEMVSKSYLNNLEQLVAEGKVSVSRIDDAVRRILRVKFRMGLFNQPYADTTQRSLIFSPDHLAVARRVVQQSVVLLKNDQQLLPLSRDIRKIAIIGPLADAPADQMGCWVFDGRPGDVITPLKAFTDSMGNNRVIYASGLRSSRDTSDAGFAQALAAARSADAVLLFAGEESVLSGEARCRAFLDLPGIQDRLINAVAATGKPLVLVVMAGRPLTFEKAAAKARAILYAWHPGTMGGPGIYDLVFGYAAPSAKLTITIPRTIGQVPIYYCHKNTGRPPIEKAFGIPTGTPQNPIGYNSNFLDVSVTPCYPFGFGLTYTQFEYSDIALADTSLSLNDTLLVSATVRNTGTRTADEVIQLYIRDMAASLIRPVRELKGFQKFAIEPGQQKRVVFKLPVYELGFYNNENKFLVEPGRFTVWVSAHSADDRLKAEFRIE